MQHAHRAYEPARPCGSKYLQHKWDKSDWQRHRDRVKSAKATISSSPPRKFGHLEVKLKKLQLEEDRASKIQRDNELLLDKMSHIKKTAGRVEHRNHYSSRSLSSEKRRRELLRVTRENRALLERLSRCGSSYSVARWHEDWLRSNRYGDNIARYPRGALLQQSPQGTFRGLKTAAKGKNRECEKSANFQRPRIPDGENESGAAAEMAQRAELAAGDADGDLGPR